MGLLKQYASKIAPTKMTGALQPTASPIHVATPNPNGSVNSHAENAEMIPIETYATAILRTHTTYDVTNVRSAS